MALFTGTFANKVDGKGRVSLPADYRGLLPEQDSRSFYIFPSPRGGFLEACDRAFMERVQESIEEQAEIFSEEEDGLNYILSEARRVQFDDTGRFVLPSEFMEEANITEQAMFVGAGGRFQIWNPEAYGACRQQKREKVRNASLRLKPRGPSS